MRLTLKRNDREIKPYTSVERTRCPFYGFNTVPFYGFNTIFDIMSDSEGNQCALKAGYSPCGIEIAGNEPNWSECRFNTEENKTKLAGSLEKVKVFPREFRPPGKKGRSWEGIPLKIWMDYIDKIHKE